MRPQAHKPNLLKVIIGLKGAEAARHELAQTGELPPALAELRSWQSLRLEHTYADLLADPQYQPACRFFLTQIYAPVNFRQRDEDFNRLHALLSRHLPAQMLKVLSDGLYLNRLSEALDQELLAALQGIRGEETVLQTQHYVEAYRLCNNYASRVEQINLLTQLIREVGEGAHLPGVGLTLRLARIPAQRMGWEALYDFLSQGYAAFQPMLAVADFAGEIRRREHTALDRIYSHQPDPFQVEGKDVFSTTGTH